jgi:hypothetical protein
MFRKTKPAYSIFQQKIVNLRCFVQGTLSVLLGNIQPSSSFAHNSAVTVLQPRLTIKQSMKTRLFNPLQLGH